jgi:MYXO-CTERM domain-containing protein
VLSFDHSVTGLYDYTGELAIGEGTDIPLDPEATYNMVLVHRNCPYTQVFVEGISDQVVPPPQGGAGGAAGSGGKAGAAGKAGSAGKAGAAGRGQGGAGGQTGLTTEPVESPEVGGGCQSSSAPPAGSGLGALLAIGALLRRRR